LRSGVDPRVDMRDRFRGALIGRVIGDAMGRPSGGEVRGRQMLETVSRGPEGTVEG
jgi:ADP-ribosylglycohydrolase